MPRVSGCLRAAGDAGLRVAGRPEIFAGLVYHTSVYVKVKSGQSRLSAEN
jgi:hypothetical protein